MVLEDTISRICRILDIDEKGVLSRCADLRTEMRDILTTLKATHARAAAGLPASAVHARYDEIELSDVNPAIEFTRELMARI